MFFVIFTHQVLVNWHERARFNWLTVFLRHEGDFALLLRILRDVALLARFTMELPAVLLHVSQLSTVMALATEF